MPASTAPNAAAAQILAAMASLDVSSLSLVLVEVSQSNAARWAAVERLVEERKVQALGLAGATLEQAVELLETATVKPVANFIELHPLHSQRNLVGQLLRKVWRACRVNEQEPESNTNCCNLRQA